MLSLTKQIHEKTVFNLLGSMQEPTFLIDPEGRLLFANDAFAKKLEAYALATLNTNVFELQPSIPEIATGLWEQVDRVLSGCHQLEFEEEHDGRMFHYVVTPECTAWGDITRLYVIVYELSVGAGEPQVELELNGRRAAG